MNGDGANAGPPMEDFLGLFKATSGEAELPAPGSYLQEGSEYMRHWRPITINAAEIPGSGIMNSYATLMPNTSDGLRDTGLRAQWRLGNGLGVARQYRKPDDVLAHGYESMLGPLAADKLFGRNQKSTDLTWMREELASRARQAMPARSSRNDEVPEHSNYQAYDYQNNVLLGVAPRGLPSQYNRNSNQLSAEAVKDRLYRTPNSRVSKSLPIDIEVDQLRPQRTRMQGARVVRYDPTSGALVRAPRNVDVLEAVSLEAGQGSFPRGMGPPNGQQAVPVHPDTRGVFREPLGNTAVAGAWANPGSSHPLAAETINDQIIKHREYARWVRGHDLAAELGAMEEDVGAARKQRGADPYNLKHAADEMATRSLQSAGAGTPSIYSYLG